ncbi:MAG TPA: feruloyl-CoA synthase [Burkholderiaceae bacterium]|nr:feruloyl-CoA synthase [Burkholderiaceae bacterium]
MSGGVAPAPGAAPRYRAARVGGCLDAQVERGPGGAIYLRSTEALEPFPARLTDRLAHWAAQAPDRLLVAQRDAEGRWREIRYGAMLERARRLGQALLDSGLSADRPLLILSDNDLEHFSLMMGAMWAGIPFASVTSAYSRLSRDFAKLRHVFDTLTPGMIFASDGATYGPALEAVAAGRAVDIVVARGEARGRGARRFDDLLAVRPTAALDAAHAATGPDTVVKFLFTSGSTRQPKAVVNTQRMLCANQQMLRQCLRFLEDEPPILVDWLPWSHTFGGNHNTGIVVFNGGTLYIDEGRPTPAGIAETLRNLREISPTVYFNVPKGFEEIAAAMEHDAQLRASLLRRVRAFFFAGAGLSQVVWDQLDRIAESAVGERIPIITGLGMTETAPSCTFAVKPEVAASGHIGLPCPGVDVKLVPVEAKTEIRFRGPNVMPGYWRDAKQTEAAFDDEGFYRTGDAVRLADPAEPALGIVFDGRIAEDFKLATGTFVSVGPLRARVVQLGDPFVQDAVVAGIDRDELGLLFFPRLDACRELASLPPQADRVEVLHHPRVREKFQDLLDRLHESGTGSATRPVRAHILVEPPSIDRGEITDKGSINQRAVLAARAALVDALYIGAEADPYVLIARRAAPSRAERDAGPAAA